MTRPHERIPPACTKQNFNPHWIFCFCYVCRISREFSPSVNIQLGLLATFAHCHHGRLATFSQDHVTLNVIKTVKMVPSSTKLWHGGKHGSFTGKGDYGLRDNRNCEYFMLPNSVQCIFRTGARAASYLHLQIKKIHYKLAANTFFSIENFFESSVQVISFLRSRNRLICWL